MHTHELHSETLNPRRAAAELREQTLQRLAHQSADWAYRIAYDLLGTRAEAEDAVQEALARSCASVDKLRDPRAADARGPAIVMIHPSHDQSVPR